MWNYFDERDTNSDINKSVTTYQKTITLITGIKSLSRIDEIMYEKKSDRKTKKTSKITITILKEIRGVLNRSFIEHAPNSFLYYLVYESQINHVFSRSFCGSWFCEFPLAWEFIWTRPLFPISGRKRYSKLLFDRVQLEINYENRCE